VLAIAAGDIKKMEDLVIVVKVGLGCFGLYKGDFEELFGKGACLLGFGGVERVLEIVLISANVKKSLCKVHIHYK